MSDIELAFAHPEARALATAPDDLCDRISLRDHLVEADIGAFQKERGHKQRLRFNIVVEVRPVAEPLEDDVDRILSYDKLTETVAVELAAERLNLLETLAERLALRILAEPAAMRVFVRIEKLDVGPYALGVEIVRSRPDQPETRPQAGAVYPLVVHLDNATLQASDISARLDRLLTEGLPMILTLGPPDGARIRAGHQPSQWRIDLLAIEQNAWALAAKDPRFAVVATRTEIDWAMRRGKSVIWAPSKLVLDAVDGPKDANPQGLALWLAETLAATALVVHGEVSVPAGSRVPLRRA